MFDCDHMCLFLIGLNPLNWQDVPYLYFLYMVVDYLFVCSISQINILYFRKRHPVSIGQNTAPSHNTSQACSTMTSHSIATDTSTKPDSDESDCISAQVSGQLPHTIKHVVNVVLNDTGLTGRELFRCTELDCTATADDKHAFSMHMKTHKPDYMAGYQCYHCNVSSVDIISLVKHIASHARHHYLCILCDHTCAEHLNMVRHLGVTHNHISLVDLDLDQISGIHNSSDSDQIVGPRRMHIRVLYAFGMRLYARHCEIKMQRNQRNHELQHHQE